MAAADDAGCPRWVHVLSALSTIVYVNLDCIDVRGWAMGACNGLRNALPRTSGNSVCYECCSATLFPVTAVCAWPFLHFPANCGFAHFHAECGLMLIPVLAPPALQGKQARRTKSSSPLGQLFDHGCDALSVHLLLSNTQVRHTRHARL